MMSISSLATTLADLGSTQMLLERVVEASTQVFDLEHP
jgi:hypothetical protein